MLNSSILIIAFELSIVKNKIIRIQHCGIRTKEIKII